MLGVEEAVAEEMAEEKERGYPLKMPSPGVNSVIGEQGSGKTLAVERLFQVAALDAADNSSQPFPIFIRARDLTRSILNTSRDVFSFHQLKVCVDANP